MSISTTSYPSRIIEGSTLKSRYHSAFNPIIYALQRKDYVVSSVTKYALPDAETTRTTSAPPVSSYDIVVTLASPITGDDVVTEGDFIYLKSGNYDAVGEVIAAYSLTQFRLHIPWTGNSVGGFINLNTSRIGYYVETEVLVEQNGIYEVAGTIRSVPDTKGAIELDASEWVQIYVDLRNQYQYDGAPNKAERETSGIFNLRYTEAWQDNEGTAKSATITDSAYQFYMGSVRQVMDEYGQNMAVFVPHYPKVASAEWLTDFEKPTYFPGYPFDISFIFSDLMSGYTCSRRVREYDQNLVINVAQADESLDISERFYVNRMSIDEPAIDTAEVQMEIILNTTVPSVDRAVEDGYVDPEYWTDEVPAEDVIVDPPSSF
jgi:hypothetical protein